MRPPKLARFYTNAFSLVAAGALLTGCATDSTAPKAPASSSQRSASPFRPTAAQKALVGVTDGIYTFTIDPKADQSLSLGPNHLELPANAICDLSKSRYGIKYWNDQCSPERDPVTITAVVTNANTNSPSIDFYPAMRFNPNSAVELYIYVPTGLDDFAARWTMEYCPTAGWCYDEARYDRDLQTLIDPSNNVVFRRIKHFSGYVVAERADGMGGDGFAYGW